MPEKKENDILTLQLSRAELFQIHLSIVCRSAAATIKWSNATSKEEQDNLRGEIGFLTELTKKVSEVLDKWEKVNTSHQNLTRLNA